TASTFSLRSLIQPISSVLDSSAAVVSEASASPFDISTCGKGKGCFLPDGCVPGTGENGCMLAYSFRPLDDVTVEMELYATIENEITDKSYWVAVGFSDDENMGHEAVTECSFLTSEKQPSIKASYNFYGNEENKSKPDNRRIQGEEDMRSKLFNTTTITVADGAIYCKFTQKIGGLGNVNCEFLATDCKTPHYFLMAKGSTTDTEQTKFSDVSESESTFSKPDLQTGSASSLSLFTIPLMTVGKMLF
ncbi:hypothetical protein PMAYCL1PPCAC_26631, partial [Pristionchus mayeri]